MAGNFVIVSQALDTYTGEASYVTWGGRMLWLGPLEGYPDGVNTKRYKTRVAADQALRRMKRQYPEFPFEQNAKVTVWSALWQDNDTPDWSAYNGGKS